MNSWADLPNAKCIDEIIESVSLYPETWNKEEWWSIFNIDFFVVQYEIRKRNNIYQDAKLPL